MKNILIGLILFSFISCNNKNERIEYFFAPSFMLPTSYRIDLKNSTLLLKNYNVEKESEKWDTVQGDYEKIFKIKKKDLSEFRNEIKKIKLDSSIVHNNMVLDGIGFKYSEISKKDTITVTTSSPRRDSIHEIEYIALDAFFNLAYKTIDDYKGLVTTENIHDFFSHELPIKQTSKNPIEFRVWGIISGCTSDNPDLIKFLDSLPSDKPIIIDSRNGSFAFCLDSLLNSYNKRKSIYYYGDYYLKLSKKELNDNKIELQKAKKENNKKEISLLNNEVNSSQEFLENYEKYLFSNPNRYKSRKEILKTIANIVQKQ